MSMKRDHDNGPIKGFSCEAEDLTVSGKKRVKRAPQKIITHGSHRTDDAFRKVQDNKLLTVTITEIMDIQEPISKLRSLLEARLGIDLSSFIIVLQDNIELEPDMSLGEQCIQSHGVAEIKVELKQQNGIRCINILDVLRLPQEDDDNSSLEEDLSGRPNTIDMAADDKSDSSSESRNSPTPFSWTILQDMNSLFEIDFPGAVIESWSQIHVQHWLKWAMKEFNIEFIDDSMWIINGKQLSKMTIDQFHSKVPVDPFNMLWTHIELLRKCQIFAIVEKVGEASGTSLTRVPKTPRNPVRKPRTPSTPISALPTTGRRSSLTGHNGQIQLWQFLLELLGDKNSKNVIQWVGREGEFKLIDPELVAQMWGQRKNKPKMNYEKLSRALRYYYSECMIAKVHGRRFVYKFVCNLKELVGYSTQELIDLVEDDPVEITPVS